MDSNERISALKSALSERILVVDGAMGTAIQSFDLGPDDFGGIEYEGCNEHLVLTRPDVIESIHKGHLDAGADIIETDTFGSTAIVLSEYDLAHEARRLNRVAAELARDMADAATTPEKPRFVAGSMGPTTKTISVTGGVTFDELVDNYQEQAAGLIEGGVDVLLLETGQDTLNIKAGLEGIDRALAELDREVPVAVQGTVEPMGTLLAGQDVEALYVSLAHRDLLWIGINCATGPRLHDRPHPYTGFHFAVPRGVRPQRRDARRGRQVQREPGGHGSNAGAVRRFWLGQPGRRLLRHRKRPHPPAG